MNLPDHELRFEPLGLPSRAFVFPCDSKGHVDLDSLSVRALNNYLFARAVVGRRFSRPTVASLGPWSTLSDAT